jgi:hypothetical protein
MAMTNSLEREHVMLNQTLKEEKKYPVLVVENACKLYHLRLRVECTFFCNLQSWARTHAVLVISLYELLDPTT